MRISTITQTNRTETNILNLQRELTRAEQQVSSGKISSVFSGLKGEDARISVQLRESVTSKESFIETIERTRLRTSVMDAGLLQIQDLADDLRTELIKQTDSLFQAELPIIQRFADNAIDRLTSLLNTRVAGRFIFSGPLTSTQPILDPATIKANFAGAGINTAVNGATNTAATILGNVNTFFNTNANWNNLNAIATTQETTVHVDKGLNVSYGEMAHQEAFADLFEILNIFANVTVDPGQNAEYRNLFDSARTTIETAFDTINQMVADLGIDQARFDAVEEAHREDIVVIGEQIGNVEDVDALEAANLFQTLRGQIETSFQVTALTRDLTLARFL